ncbi:helix-turn-helix domain-containing protein [Thalassospira sp.]|uniref:helix-turn-helix domain-containing protein n=1 Tax=Thalassospira sp. TaxID=1912094 RepID=UPI003AA90804
MLSTQLINGIRRYRQTEGLSIRGYARLAGVSEPPIRGIDSPNWNPTFKTLAKFEAVIPPEFMASANENDGGNGGGGHCAQAGSCKSAAA